MIDLLAIDPGPEHSAYVALDEDGAIVFFEDAENEVVKAMLGVVKAKRLALEWVASYGMPVGAETFDTCLWVGRFIERWGLEHGYEPQLIFRKTVVTHICGSSKATDANIRQALIDRYGPGKERAIGVKAAPGPLYKMNGHCRSALALGITAREMNGEK